MGEMRDHQYQPDILNQKVEVGQKYHERRFANRVHAAFGAGLIVIGEFIMRPENQQIPRGLCDVLGTVILTGTWVKGTFNRINFESGINKIERKAQN